MVRNTIIPTSLALGILLVAMVPLAPAEPLAADVMATASPLDPITLSSAACGGNAPLQTSCSTAGTITCTSMTIGARSTLAYTGYINVEVTSSSSTASFTAYFVGGFVVAQTPLVQTGTFWVGETYTLSGFAGGSGGWQVYVNNC